ncbi:hypothetical protein BZA77DRAFT_160688 [Pyronema omphalodes]|nr:hypothetical protein BZA77DRAFT_160688 [Pyronema omphalodes]
MAASQTVPKRKPMYKMHISRRSSGSIFRERFLHRRASSSYSSSNDGDNDDVWSTTATAGGFKSAPLVKRPHHRPPPPSQPYQAPPPPHCPHRTTPLPKIENPGYGLQLLQPEAIQRTAAHRPPIFWTTAESATPTNLARAMTHGTPKLSPP